MTFTHRTRTVVFALVALLGIAGVTFALYWFTQKPVYLLPKTAQGNQLENYVPSDANLLFALDTSDLQLSELLKKTTGHTVPELMALFANELAADEEFPKEVAAQIAKSTQFVMAGTVPFLDTFASESVATFKDSVDEDGSKPTFTVVTEVQNPAEVAPALEKLKKEGEGDTGIALVGSVLIFSTQTQSQLDANLARPAYMHQYLGYKKSFQQLAKKLPLNHFAAFYVDQNSLKNTTAPNKKEDKDSNEKPAPSAELLAAASMSAEGVVFDAFSSILPRETHLKLTQLAQTKHPSLLNKLPTAGLLLVGESYGLADVFAYDPLFTAFVKGTLSMDYEKDLRPILQKASALVLSDAGSLIPALSIYNEIDSTEAAKPFIAKLDTLLANVITFANFSVKTDPAQGPFIERTPITNNGVVATTLSAHPERLSVDAGIDASLLTMIKMLKLTYGTAQLGDTLVSFVSTQPDVIEALHTQALIGKGMQPLNDYAESLQLQGQTFYIDVDSLGSFVARIMAEFSKNLPEADRSDIQQVGVSIQKTLAHFDALFAVSGADDTFLINKALLKTK